MGKPAKDLLQKLLEKIPRRRIGYGGVDQIKQHKFFKGIDWDKLKKR